MTQACGATLPPLQPGCRISVVIPARNEAALLGLALAALDGQRDFDGRRLAAGIFEVIVFANNCADTTAAVARRYAALAPALPIHVIEADLRLEDAHIGAARKYVMDVAAARFLAAGKPSGLIASTDSDTVVDAQWIAWTLREASSVDAVAGQVAIGTADQQRLHAPVRLLYARELTYRRLRAEIEALIDPRPEDPLPRHNAFVGASFAVSAQTYIAAGTLPPLPRLEDLNFAQALNRIDARIRHSPFVRATTSPRVSARVEGGFGTFVAHLHERAARGESFRVEHPQQTLDIYALRAGLRRLWTAEADSAEVAGVPARFAQAHASWRRLLNRTITFGRFYERIAALDAAPALADVGVEAAIDTLRAAVLDLTSPAFARDVASSTA